MHYISPFPPKSHIIGRSGRFELHDHDSLRIGIENGDFLNVSEFLAAAFDIFVELGFEVGLCRSAI